VLSAARFDETTGQFEWVAHTEPQTPMAGVPDPLTTRVDVFEDHAFMGSRGMLMVVDLKQLPDALVVTDVRHLLEPDGVSSTVRGSAGFGDYVFVGSTGSEPRRSKLRIYGFDPGTGLLSAAPAVELTSDDPELPENFEVSSRLKLAPNGERLYVCGNLGRLFSFDVKDPLAPKVLSTWGDQGIGLTTDCSVETFTLPNGTAKELVMLVVQTQAFKLLDPFAN
jgi:hypothetical protein